SRGYRKQVWRNFRIAIGKEGITGWVAAHRKPAVVPDVRRDPRYIQGIIHGRSEIAVPLLIGKQLIGVLDVESEKINAFSRRDLKILSLFAAQAAVAIENARLYQECKQAKDRLQKLIESSSDAITTADNRGRLVFWSKGAEEIFGYKAAEVVGQSAAPFYAKGREEARRIMGQLLRKGQLKNIEVDYLGKDGRKIFASLSASLLRDERGEVTGSLGIIRDITEFRVLSQQLLQSERLATIGQLSTQIAHEIMNPLSSIKMNIRILSKREGLSANDRRRLEIATFEIDHLGKILQDIFDYSRTLQLNLSHEDINEVLEKSLLMVQDRLEEKQVSVTKRFNHKLPRVTLDLVRMMQVFTNLFLNAIQAVKRGGKVIAATGLGRDAKGRFLKVTLADNGMGIDPAQQISIFDPFHTTKSDGTGLGLTVVKKIVEQHNGRIEVESQAGKYTRFTILLPLTRRG
ncbi:MAG: PAS domain S-box protein, partial [Acidobacteria bacterium]|nr:PAS domain S-box protein [Acidobacteriota bacterium]